jgi:predicted dehydrogenase
MPNAGRYSNDNLAATLRFADGSIGTITYIANGDKSFSKERVEVFVQGRVAILDDYRELQMIHDGKHRVTKLHLRADKGHRGEWEAFADVIRSGGQSPISLNELLNSTLATFALVRASSDGSMIEVSTEQFLSQVRGGRLAVHSRRED